MELKDFIEYVLVDIAEGITAARDRVGEKIAINPASVDGQSAVERDYVNFDIAVTVHEKNKHTKSGSIKGGATISVVSASTDGAKKQSNNSGAEKVSKVSFRVPVYYSATYKKLGKK